MATKKVIFVNTDGSSERDYDRIIEDLSKILEEISKPVSTGITDFSEKIATTTVVKSTAEAVKMIGQGGIDSLVFLSKDMISKARQVKKEYPRVRVIVFTGLFPEEEEVIIFDKIWLSLDSKHLVGQIIVGVH